MHLLRRQHRSEARPLAGIQYALAPFFSPDSQWIGFFEGNYDDVKELRKVSIRGGPAITLCRCAQPVRREARVLPLLVTSLVLLAHAVLTVVAARERLRSPAGHELIPLTVNEIRHCSPS